MNKLLIVLSLFTTSTLFSQQYQDNIYRIMYKDTDLKMSFGSQLKIHDSVVELTEYFTDSVIYAKKNEIDYVKTPYGYLSFEPKIRKVSLAQNRSVHVMLLGSTGISARYKYLGGSNKDYFNWAGSLEIDFNPWTGSQKREFFDWRIGFGAEYQVPRRIMDVPGKCNFMSFFGLTKFLFNNDNKISPGLFGRYGINYFNANSDFPEHENLSGSYYLSTGFFVSFSHVFEIRGAYTFNRGYITVNQLQNVVNYQAYDLIFGVALR